MAGSSHGYDVSVGYSYHFYPEMAPDWLDLCALVVGHAPPREARRCAFRYLELGSGQGMGLCLLAAANPQGEFAGVDFLPQHIDHAEGIAKAAGLTNIRFHCADFLDLAERWPDDFGSFDYVALHGVYSWVSPEVREALVRCLGHATHAGSLVYNSYNAQPGWLSTMPFQHISYLLKEMTGKPATAAVEDSIALFDRLRAGGADTFKILPGLRARLEAVKTRKTDYLVHEYLHESWHPLWHSEVAKEFARAELGYVGSATLAETMLPGVLPPPLRDAIAAQSGDRLRQDVQDFVINQSFRRDIFVRGQRLGTGRRSDEIARLPLYLLAPPEAGRALEIVTTFGEITLQPPAFAEIVAALGDGSKSIAELAGLPAMRGLGIENLLQIVLLLLHARVLAVGAVEPGDAESAQRLNAVVARGAAEGAPYDHIAAGRLGSAIAATATELLLLKAWLEAPGGVDAEALGRGIDGGTAAATRFQGENLTRWRRLGVVV